MRKTMAPLSEHEKTQLRRLEQQLQADDPKFVKAMRSRRSRRSFSVWHRNSIRNNTPFNVAGASLGICIFIVGVVAMHNPYVSFLGIALLITGVYRLVVLTETEDRAPRLKTKSAFMVNLECRWDERKRNEL
jgi:Flp pilus assembly protein TadB